MSLRNSSTLARALLVGIGGGGDLLAEDDIGAALGPHDRDLRRGPRDDQVGLVGLAAHDEVARAVGLAHHHRDLRHRRLAHGVEHLGAVADDALLLDLGADHEARARPGGTPGGCGRRRTA